MLEHSPAKTVSELVERSKKFIRRAKWVRLGEEDSFCGKFFTSSTCQRELHIYACATSCGREWHSVCGADGSRAHLRRVSRIAWRVFWLGSQGKSYGLGYWVFTIPLQIRDRFRKQSALRRANRFLVRLLKEHGFKESSSRWHPFGSGEIVEGELNLGEYHPHLNVLVSGRKLSKKRLKAIREAWRRYLEVMSGESIDVVNIHYQYFPNPAQWMHKAKYICRATFKRLEGNEDLALALYRFTNISHSGFGRGTELEKKKAHGQALYEIWKSDTKDVLGEEIREHDKKSSGDNGVVCPECAKEGIYSRLHARQTFNGFREVLSLEEVMPRIVREIGFGFYLLKDIILTNKPRSLDEGSSEQDKEAYDSS